MSTEIERYRGVGEGLTKYCLPPIVSHVQDEAKVRYILITAYSEGKGIEV